MPSRRVRSTVRQTMIRTDQFVRAELEQTVKETAHTVYLELQAGVLTWVNKPKFTEKTKVTPFEISAQVTVDQRTRAGKIFTYIDKGTGIHGPKKAPYKIRPKKRRGGSGYLKFRTGYLPKTAPVAKNARIARVNVGPGSAVGGWVQVKEVTHPGIEARRIVETAVNNLKPDFRRRIDNAIRRAIRRAAN